MLVGCTTMLMAQYQRTTPGIKPLATYENTAENILNLYTDSLKTANINAQTSQAKDLMSNPYYYRLFVSPMLYRSPLRWAMKISPESFGDPKIEVGNALNGFFNSLYIKHPHLVGLTETSLDHQQPIREDLNTKVEHKTQVSEIVKPKKIDNIVEPIEAISRKPNFWSFSQSIGVHLQQYYFSDNWYQGGTNYNTMLLTYRLYANYNNKQKVTFNNTLEMDLGFQTDKNDKEHKFKTNTDRLRLTNNFGLQASGNWYYSAMLQSWTQFCPKYNDNSNTVYSDFMSPFESTFSVGMKYERRKGPNNLTIHIAPISVNFKYVDRENLRSRNGIRGDHHSTESFGPNLNASWDWRIFKELLWHGRFYYFTNYEKVQVEWENTFTFTINKYLNTKLFLYPRFDDSYKSSKSDAVIQFKEWLSLGLNLNF